MRLPVHTAECSSRAVGAPAVDVAVHVSRAGSYLPPVFVYIELPVIPPHTIIRLPVQMAVWYDRTAGAFVVEIGVQVSSGTQRLCAASTPYVWTGAPPTAPQAPAGE